MPNLNIPVNQDLLRAIRVKAASEDKSRREWILERLEDAVMVDQAVKLTARQNNTESNE